MCRFASRWASWAASVCINLEGVQTRYENPGEVLEQVVNASKDEVTALIQKIYLEPIKEELITRRVKELKKAGVSGRGQFHSAKSRTLRQPSPRKRARIFRRAIHRLHRAAHFHAIQIARPRELSASDEDPRDRRQRRDLQCDAGIDAMRRGGRVDRRWARRRLHEPRRAWPGRSASDRHGRLRRGARLSFQKDRPYVPIITDGGMSKGGDVCKALACGSDAVMVGSAFARAEEAPGQGNHWGMATPHANLPRGTRIKVGVTGSLKQILFGPPPWMTASQNLVGAITTCMGNVGAASIREFQETEIIIAPSIKTEGKLFQAVQNVGMGTK